MTPEDFAPLIDIAKARRQQAEAHHAKITLRERQLRDFTGRYGGTISAGSDPTY